MKSKHTPGPWTVAVVANVAYVQDSRARWDVCEVRPYDPNFEREANIRLIAAAPLMLEALKHARALVQAADLGPSSDTALRMYDAAIAKAEGES